MLIPNLICRTCLIAALTLAGAPVVSAGIVEKLSYRAIYSGVFSLGRPLPIADVEFQTRSLGEADAMREFRITASSENYDHVESFYPLRYRFRTWATADEGRLIGFENYEQTRRSRHRLYLRDDSGVEFRRYDIDEGAGDTVLASLEAGINPAAVPRDGFVDRLGLLQTLRERDLSTDRRFDLAVTRGKETLDYVVHVQAVDQIELGGRSVSAWKVKLEGYEHDPDGNRQPAHRPVFVWFSLDPRHVPLRVESRHPIGTFLVELDSFAALRASEVD
jgi:hypothetical protein